MKMFVVLCIGESPIICLFLKTIMQMRPKGPESHCYFQEWTDTRTLTDLKYILA